ncbi:hypothetical protein UCRPA7_2030 [Phaeoacremonium minimum UCRPA7]|uniref:Uncharacterized protein n=1 Tax=Phaeoacremonium minimum (strain UCR-PA7) TaxID=1286976 RepID=R8BSZ0_PHAM7|nr:hypothetical protein UCRPA7_2030 [Phaeoacremonium minimum UCRPA7]EOO02419.1 hypothetical protein UCRPA7_2030 [Phaeoacremonium minimum UCRPA7]
MWIRELFYLVCGSLRRLVIDMPLRSLYPADDHLNVRKTLREGFSTLTKLEEFVSVRDELYLRVYEREWLIEEAEVWTLWPALRRLALYNVDADEQFWGRVAGMPKLETLILTRADGMQETCIKSSYFAATQRPIDVLIVNVSTEHPREIPRWAWQDVDPQMKMQVMVYDVPTSFYGDEDYITLCQDWVKAAALRGTLWDWKGYLLQPAPVGSGLTNPEPETSL